MNLIRFKITLKYSLDIPKKIIKFAENILDTNKQTKFIHPYTNKYTSDLFSDI